MYEIAPSQVARAVDILKNGPMHARTFAEKMWPGRHNNPGKASKAGHAVLQRLGAVGYVERAGDLWLLRGFPRSSVDSSAVQSATGPAFGPPTPSPMGLPMRSPVGSGVQLPTGSPIGSPDEQLERQRLQELVALADSEVVGVTHDVALGNLRIRGMFVDDCVVEACSFAVLGGRSINVYPPGPGGMLVNLSPAEAAHALFLKWKQSGVAPELPYRGGSAWLTLDDGVVAARGCWRPLGAPPQWQTLEEPLGNRIARQRAEAGLGPPVQR